MTRTIVTQIKPRDAVPSVSYTVRFPNDPNDWNWIFRDPLEHGKGSNVKFTGLCIISGGQTGADRAGLDVANLMGISTGGWAAVDYMTSEGPDPSLKDLGLLPIATGPGAGYADRTRKNIELADVTLIFAFDRSSAGTRLTINHCINKKQPYYVVDLGKDDLATKPQQVVAWLKSHFKAVDLEASSDGPPFVLNIAGNREVPGTTKVYDATAAFVSAILRYWSTWEES